MKLAQRQQWPHLNIITVVVVSLVLILNNLHLLLDNVILFTYFSSLSFLKYLIEQANMQEGSLFNLKSVPKIYRNAKCILLQFICNMWNLFWNLSFWKRQGVSDESFNNCNYVSSHACISYLKRSLQLKRNEIKIWIYMKYLRKFVLV